MEAVPGREADTKDECKWGYEGWQKAAKMTFIIPVYFHLKGRIQMPPATVDKGNRIDVSFQHSYIDLV